MKLITNQEALELHHLLWMLATADADFALLHCGVGVGAGVRVRFTRIRIGGLGLQVWPTYPAISTVDRRRQLKMHYTKICAGKKPPKTIYQFMLNCDPRRSDPIRSVSYRIVTFHQKTRHRSRSSTTVYQSTTSLQSSEDAYTLVDSPDFFDSGKSLNLYVFWFKIFIAKPRTNPEELLPQKGHQSVWSAWVSVCPPVRLSICPSVRLSVFFGCSMRKGSPEDALRSNCLKNGRRTLKFTKCIYYGTKTTATNQKVMPT